MYNNNKKQVTFDGPSYYQDSSRKYIRDDSIQGLRARLGGNFTKMVELLVERRQLLKKLAQVMMSQNSMKLQSISKAKNNELKNEARLLKDEAVYNLLQNAQKYNSSNKTIIKSIVDLNPKSLEADQSKKSKSYYDQIKRIDTDRTMAINKFKQQSSQLTKFNDQQRKIFRQIQLLQQNKIMVLTSKQIDHIKKAQKIQQQIEKHKLFLKNNRNIKDKRKRQLAFQIQKILQMTKRYQTITINRTQDISQMIGGCQTIQQFQFFIKSFQTVLINKLQTKKQDQKILLQIVRRSAYYDKLVQQIQKQVAQQAYLFDTLNQAYKKQLTLSLLQKAYLTNVPTDRNSLISIINKCQSYRSLLDRLADQKSKSKWQTQKARQVLDYFEPILKTINTEQKRKEQLKQKIAKIMNAKYELEKLQKRQQNFEFQLTNLLLQKQAISKPMQQAAKRGNLQEYKIKMAQLQKIEQQIVAFSQTKNDHKLKEQTAKLNLQIEQLNRQYSSIIEQILAGQKQMSFFTFLQKLSKRLMLI